MGHRPIEDRFVMFARAYVFAALVSALPACAQTVLGATPNNQPTSVIDSSILVPPAGDKIAILVWEDLECPYCAHAFPTVHVAAKVDNIPLVERDFLIPGHVWSPRAALYARYVHDKLGETLGTQYRREVFASQYKINSPDDLDRFTRDFFTRNNKPFPSPIDPTGGLQKEIDADMAIAKALNVSHTPTIMVVTPHHWTEVLDLDDLDKAIADEKSRVATAPTAHPQHSSAPVHP